MPSDEELRKVAEDMRALARSLARDFWEASHTARGSGRSPSEAFRRGIRDAVHGAKNEFRHGMRYGWGPPPGYGSPPYEPPPPGDSGQATGATNPGQPGHGPRGRGWPNPDGRRGGTPPYWPGYRGSKGPHGWAQSGWWSPGYAYRPPRQSRRRQPPPPVRRKWDASLLAAALAVVFGVAWLVSGLGAVHLATEAVLAAGLMLLGITLIFTARTDWSLSRHAWPVVVGLLLVIGLFATSTSFGVTGALSHLSFGDMHATAQNNGGTVYGGFGQLTVDAGKLQPGSTLHVQSVAGETRVTLAPGETAVVQGKVLAGQVCVDGHQSASGIGASSSPVTVQPGSQEPVHIDVHQLAGQIVVGGSGCSQ